MIRTIKHSLVYYAAGILLVIEFLLSLFTGRAYCLISLPPLLDMLYYLGWFVWAFAVFLLFIPYFTDGDVKAGKGKSQATDEMPPHRGIFNLIRQPENLGWLLVYLALIFFRPDLLIIIPGAAGMACVLFISRLEDVKNVEKLGRRYEKYMREVPAMNLVLGIARRIKH
jgi:protein-S-isoprenylcysteine O-methyltransferase Ste14